MKVSITRPDVWAAIVDDRPGGVADKLAALADAGANLGLVLARRTPEQRGSGVVFVAPLKGSRQTRAAEKSGFQRTESVHSVRVEAPDKPGLCARVTQAVADAGINLRGISATSLGKRSVTYLALDTARQAQKVAGILRQLR